MNDVRNILIKALKSQLATATGKTIYVRMPKAADIAYPYIQIADVYQTEDGPKTSYYYNLDVLIRVVYKDANDLGAMFTDMNNISSVIKNYGSFALDSPFVLRSAELNNSSHSDFESDTGTLSIGLIRIDFDITGA